MPGQLATILEMIKFAHSVFALPFAAIALLLAGRHLPGGWPRPGQVVLALVCMVAARSVAMTFNRLVDAAIDARNPRTAGRALPAGLVSRGGAMAFLAVMAAAFAAGCAGFYALYGNPWPAILGGPVLVAICGYSYAKRFTSLAHFWLGAAIGLSPVAAWIAISPETLGWPAVILGAVVTLWIGGFDIIYALQDLDFDRREGLFSLPARMGPAAALWISRLCHAGVVVLLVLLGIAAGLGTVWYGGVAMVAVLLAWEQWLVRPHDLSRVNVAFFTVNGIVGIVLAIFALADIVVARAAQAG